MYLVFTRMLGESYRWATQALLLCQCLDEFDQQHALPSLTLTDRRGGVSGTDYPCSVVCADTPPRGPAHVPVARLAHPRDRVASLWEGIGRLGSVVTNVAIGYFCQIGTRWTGRWWWGVGGWRLVNIKIN